MRVMVMVKATLKLRQKSRADAGCVHTRAIEPEPEVLRRQAVCSLLSRRRGPLQPEATSMIEARAK